MRLGAPIYSACEDPEAWIRAIEEKGYRAAYCPDVKAANPTEVLAFAEAARKADIVIAEVGVWNNPIHPNEEERGKAVRLNIEKLALAEEIGAACCVNIAGSRNPTVWHGPHADNFSPETFDLIVETTRTIIDAVRPKRTFFTLETMQWIYPAAVDQYVDLIRAIDRTAFGVHLDPVNLITNPWLLFRQKEMLRECIAKLGPHIKSCHAKDLILQEDVLTVKFDEVVPGRGQFDYSTLLREMNALDPDIPLMLEHLSSEEEYDEAAGFVRGEAAKLGIRL